MTKPWPRSSAWQFDNDAGWAVLDAVRGVAAEVGATPSAVALAYLLAQPECSSIIIGARDTAQLKDNVAATQVKLSAAQLQRLEKASAIPWGYPYDFIARMQRL